MKTAALFPFRRGGHESALTNPQFLFRVILVILAFAHFGFPSIAQTISPANLPLYFEANSDQTEFLSSGNGYQFAISASEVQMILRESGSRAATAQMRFAGGNAAARIHGGGEMPGKINYLIGNDPSKWQTGLPTFGNVRVEELYPGIDMVFHGNQRQLEYDFAIAPGANPNVIKMQFQGVDKISITSQGDLVLKIGPGEVCQPKPEIYQTVLGSHRRIAGGYKILDPQTVGFEIAGYNHTLPLLIDPVLGYSAFFGGNVGDEGLGIALDPNGNIYIAGQTLSKEFSTVGAYQTNFAGGQYNGDAFVAKFFGEPATNLAYLTYLGGSDEDAAFGLAVDANGNAFVTGYTDSPNFPTNNALFPKIPGKPNPLFNNIYLPSAYVAELNTNGSSLIYSTYLGGSNENVATSIAVDSSDNAYVVGYTYSGNFPVTNALQSHLACSNNIYLNANAFVTEIAANDTTLLYSTFLGGTNYDEAEDVALDPSNDVYVAGYSGSFNFPVWNTPTNLPYARFLSGVTNRYPLYTTFDGFVTKFPPLSTKPSSVTNLIYSMFLGGTNNDVANGVSADASGNAYVTGWTASTNFPVINSPPGLSSFLTTNGIPAPVATNVFLTKIAPDGSAVLDSTVFGGRATDIGYRVAVDANGDAFVTGWESSANFPTTNSFGSLLATNSTITGNYDAFVTGISADWSNVFYSVCIGGNQDTFGYGIALDSSTNVFITGGTDSTNYPTFNTGRFWFNGTNFINGTNYINGARFTGTNDAFLSEIVFAPGVPVVSIEPTNLTIGLGATAVFNATVSGAAGQIIFQWQTNGTNLVNGGRISGANSLTLTITNAQTSDSSTNYGMIAKSSGGTNEQSGVILTVLGVPYITDWSATNLIVGVGTNVSFSVTASGLPLFYEWGFNGTLLTTNGQISNATNNVLTVTDVTTNDSGLYTSAVVNKNTDTYTNFNFFLTVAVPQSIITAPSNQTVNAGSTVSFAVVATGFPLNYQWSTNDGATYLTDGTNSDGSAISGSATSTLTITNAQTPEAGTYTVFINNGFPPSNLILTTNFSATLTVIPTPGAVFTGFAPAAGGAGNGVVFSGTGGATNGTYYVLTSSNLMTPTSQWTAIATNQFNSQGMFIFTNPVSTNTSQFFILKQP